MVDDIGSLFFSLDTNYGPTAGQRQYFAEIQPVYRARVEEVNKFLRETLPQWNEKLRAWNADADNPQAFLREDFTRRRQERRKEENREFFAALLCAFA